MSTNEQKLTIEEVNDDGYADANEDSVHSMRIKEYLMNQQHQLPIVQIDYQLQRPKCSISPINSDLSGDSIDNVQPKSTDETHFLIPPTIVQQHVEQQCNLSPSMPIRPFPTYLTAIPTSSPYQHLIGKHHHEYQHKIAPVASLIQQLPTQSTPNKSFSTAINPRASQKRVNFHCINDLAKSSSSGSSTSTNTSSLINNNSIISQPNNSLIHSFACDSNAFHDFSSSSGYASGITNSNNNSTDISTFNFSEQLKNISMSLNNKENYNQLNYLSAADFRDNKRKPRTQINRQHRNVLEQAYMINKYPDSNEVEYLCKILGFEENVIRIWFQNKRARDKLRKRV